MRGPLAWQALPVPPRRRWPERALAAIVLVLLVLGVGSLDVPYLAVAPGSARDVDELVHVPTDKAFPARGEVLLTTVALRRVSAIEAVAGWIDDDVDVVPRHRILGTNSHRQFRQRTIQAMDDSKEAAVVTALRRLGFTVAEQGRGALVEGVERQAPAREHLHEGDVITAVEGQATALSQEAADAIRARRPGQAVTLEVHGPDGVRRTERVVLAAHPERPGGFLGVTLRTKEQRYDLPFAVRIDSAEIGGSSAGLAFALQLLDTLSEGELTGGEKVAVTGTIELDGRVGEVGGVAQKVAAARSAGARYFLVPEAEFDEAVSHAGGKLEVVEVATLEDALVALGRLGGDLSAFAPGPRRGQR
ncbi:MAG TPA: PDZ domain-containing protein [Acidimicrobiales bacterium]|nr:PDZ domain-containing protein [Acidimicrobiales bacterium]